MISLRTRVPPLARRALRPTDRPILPLCSCSAIPTTAPTAGARLASILPPMDRLPPMDKPDATDRGLSPPMPRRRSANQPITATPSLSQERLPYSRPTPAPFTPEIFDDSSLGEFSTFSEATPADCYRLHVYSHRHNCHITFARPGGDSIISMSTGNIGIKGAAKGSFDASFQLAAHVLGKIEERDIRPRAVELILRDFGPGREAFLKALMGKEGLALRGSITQVTDSSRLKFGGTRSKNLRRL